MSISSAAWPASTQSSSDPPTSRPASASPGQTGHPLVFDAAARALRAARAHGKLTAAGVAPHDVSFWIQQGVDLVFCINDLAAMKIGTQRALEQARAAIAAR